ncbi:MAG: UDP-N-acetylmuramoyl-L-alanine--D-glutamate ligase [Myxococcales bacterium]|nr:UDP-N-acetylmuramoyl-L-alanine--D-glutamate ligase [Myxococcales bacterium]|tara:strand:- start:287 stop:1675 length:1389 start_codon:yes stop_codon:yes gene_type:complete
MGTSLHMNNLRNQKIAVIGGGRAGLAAAALLVDVGAKPFLIDDAPKGQLEERLHASAFDLDIPVVGGGLQTDAFADTSVAILSPGVPRKHPALVPLIAENRLLIFNEVELAHAQNTACDVVAITGSNGKSTTATLAGALLAQADPHVFCGGNLGTPFCQGILERSQLKTAVLELSSYQLETITTLPVRLGLITNLSPDHLDRYPDAEAYYDAKWRLTELMRPDGWFVLNAKDESLQQRLKETEIKRLFNFNVSAEQPGVSFAGDLARIQPLSGAAIELVLDNEHLIGAHNYENAAAALALGHLYGLNPVQLEMGIKSYSGMAHRMERLGEAKGVLWINDSKATNVDAATTAIQCFGKGLHLFAGGVGKGSSYAPMVDAGRASLKGVYVFGEERSNLKAAFEVICPTHPCEDLAEAVTMAKGFATKGDVFLLSPACASFDQYASFEERGAHFKTLFERERLHA